MIKQDSRAYFKALGTQVTTLRKSRGMTQAELARAIGVSQQAVWAYELGERRISVLVLAKLAKIFSTSVEDIVGLSKPVRMPKGRLSPRCVRHAERLQDLANASKHFILDRRTPVTVEATSKSGFEVGRFGTGSFGAGEESIEIRVRDTMGNESEWTALEFSTGVIQAWLAFFTRHGVLT